MTEELKALLLSSAKVFAWTLVSAVAAGLLAWSTSESALTAPVWLPGLVNIVAFTVVGVAQSFLPKK